MNNVIKGKLLESKTLRQQAVNNTKEQFANSPDLKSELLSAIMGALDAHTLMSTQALNSQAVQRGLKDILPNTPASTRPCAPKLYPPKSANFPKPPIFRHTPTKPS